MQYTVYIYQDQVRGYWDKDMKFKNELSKFGWSWLHLYTYICI